MLWTIVAAVALFIFIVIAVGYEKEFAKQIDTWAANVFEGNEILIATHVIGNTGVIVAGTLLFTLLIIILKKAWQPALFTIVTVALGYGLNQLLKRIFERPRPDIVDQLTSFSFPSGHAMLTTICLLTIAFVSQRVFGNGRRIYGIYVLAVIVSLLVALSRVAEARHYFTDITAGISLGITFVIGMSFLYKKWIR